MIKWAAPPPPGRVLRAQPSGLLPPLLRRPFILLLWPYHLCVQIVCWFYRASSGERVFDQESFSAA